MQGMHATCHTIVTRVTDLQTRADHAWLISQVMDKHMSILAKSHLETKFVKVRVKQRLYKDNFFLSKSLNRC